MATIDIAHEHLHVHLKWYEKVLAWHGSVSVPLLHITDVVPGADLPSGIGDDASFHGTYIPGGQVEGTQDLGSGRHCFFDVRDPEKSVTVRLAHDRYECLVVQVDDRDPTTLAAAIMQAVRAAREKAGKPVG